jgi:hypothetical protein
VRFVLFHSPLVGPASWRPVAAALVSAGHDAQVPDLRAACLTGEPSAVVSAAVAATTGQPAVIVGHSGAGFFLPLIAEQVAPSPVGLVFVDAGVPPCQGSTTAGADFLDRLRSLAVAGVLPRWSSWWGPGVMETLVPEEGRRAELEAEMTELPLALYEAEVRMPNGWCEGAGAVLLLSEGYRLDADRARTIGWPVHEHLGNHLDIVNNPGPIAAAIIELAR